MDNGRPDEAAVDRLLCSILSRNAALLAHLANSLSDAPARNALLQLAGREGLLPALHEAVEPHLAAHFAKPERIALALAYEVNRRRNAGVRDALSEIAAATHACSVGLVALKGAAWILEDDAGFAAWRPMLDVDLLVAPSQFAAMPALLAELGYEPVLAERKLFGTRQFRGHFHLIPYRRPAGPFTIEVHRHLGWQPELLPSETVFEHVRLFAPGLALPAPWCAAFHAIIHWQIQHDGFRHADSDNRHASRNLQEVLTVARFLARDDVDWEMLAAQAKRVGRLRECTAAVALACELFGSKTPAALRASEADRRYVRSWFNVRTSPTRRLIARERGRARALWMCDRIRYKMRLRGLGAWTTSSLIWVLRLVLTPVVLLRLIIAFALVPKAMIAETAT